MLQLVFGANSPKLLQQILDELEREAQVREGVRERVGKPITSLSPEEEEQYNIKVAKEEEARLLEEQKAKQAIYDRRMAVAQVVLQNIPKNGVIIVFPQAKDMVKPTLAELWEPSGLAIALTERPTFTEAMLEELLYFTDVKFNEIDENEILASSCIAYFVKTTDADFDGDIDDVVKRFIYGEMMEPPGSPETPAQALKGYIVIQKGAKSSLELKSSTMLKESLSHASKNELRSKLQLNPSTIMHSKEMLDAAMQSFCDLIEEEALEMTGIWVPPNSLVRATAIKLLFAKVYDPIALPEPIPIPPHVAIAFDAVKRRDVLELMATYESEVMHYGFFTNDKPDQAKLIAKTIKKFDRCKDRSPTTRMVVQLSRKKSEALCNFSSLNPTYISHNTVIGEEDCKKFFPEGYDDAAAEEEIVPVEHKKRKGKKPKKAKAPSEEAITDEAEKEEVEEKEEIEEKEEVEEEEEIEEEDKATSPMPE